MKKQKKSGGESNSPLDFLKNLLISHWRSLLLMFMGVYLPLQVVEILAVKIWERPHLWVSKAPEFDYAFPSGHAMTSMTLIAIVVILT
jgi:membrane-associated phospholipid phosphatase